MCSRNRARLGSPRHVSWCVSTLACRSWVSTSLSQSHNKRCAAPVCTTTLKSTCCAPRPSFTRWLTVHAWQHRCQRAEHNNNKKWSAPSVVGRSQTSLFNLCITYMWYVSYDVYYICLRVLSWCRALFGTVRLAVFFSCTRPSGTLSVIYYAFVHHRSNGIGCIQKCQLAK